METLVGKITLGIIRHFVVGAFATASLGLDHNTQAAGVTAAMTLISIMFSVWDKMQAHAKLAAAQATP